MDFLASRGGGGGGGGGMLKFQIFGVCLIFLLVNSRCWDRAHLASKKMRGLPAPFPANMHIWVPYGLWGVQLASAWGPIWVIPYGVCPDGSHIGPT